jgi:hypothetical protein
MVTIMPWWAGLLAQAERGLIRSGISAAITKRTNVQTWQQQFQVVFRDTTTDDDPKAS